MELGRDASEAQTVSDLLTAPSTDLSHQVSPPSGVSHLKPDFFIF